MIKIKFLFLWIGLITLGLTMFEDSSAVPPLERVSVLSDTKILDREDNEIDSIRTGQQILIATPSFTTQFSLLPNVPFGCVDTIVEGDKAKCMGYSTSYQFVEGDKLVGVDELKFSQPVVSITQIADHDGVIVSLSWLEGILDKGHVLEPRISWIPEKPGTYSITTFFWLSLNNPTALAPPSSIEVTVI